MDDTLTQVQAEYGKSCTKYEEKASSKLARSDTIIISGYGCSLSVKNDALRIYPGRTHKDQQQDTVTLYRGVHGIKQIILLNDKGEITLDAICWAIDQGIAIMMIDSRGNLMQSLTPDHEPYAALRRIQYLAADSGLHIEVSRQIVRRKLHAQIETLRKCFSNKKARIPQTMIRAAVEDGMGVTEVELQLSVLHHPVWYRIEKEIEELIILNSLDALCTLEARCGVIYWYAFLGIPIKWNLKDAKVVPPHWKVITKRLSPLSSSSVNQGNGTGRRAVNPFHAVLNYAYAVLQGQCKQSLVTQGFDTACGFLHADAIHRDSLVFDVMDAGLRPEVDQLVLNLFTTTTLTKGDFMSTKDGSIKFNPQFSRYIAATCKLPQQVVDDTVVWLKGLLLGF